MTATVMDIEAASVEAACALLIRHVGLRAARVRVVRSTCPGTQSLDGGLLAGRYQEIAVDGIRVWRGEWLPEGAYRSRWEARWLVDVERAILT